MTQQTDCSSDHSICQLPKQFRSVIFPKGSIYTGGVLPKGKYIPMVSVGCSLLFVLLILQFLMDRYKIGTNSQQIKIVRWVMYHIQAPYPAVAISLVANNLLNYQGCGHYPFGYESSDLKSSARLWLARTWIRNVITQVLHSVALLTSRRVLAWSVGNESAES